jgi:hypothetical protein
MVALSSSETSASANQTACRNIPEVKTFYNNIDSSTHFYNYILQVVKPSLYRSIPVR